MAGNYKILVDQGSTWSLRLTWQDASGVPIDLNGYTARMQVRPSLESATVTISLTTANGAITLGANGAVTLSMTATQTTAITAGNYVYDVELVQGNVVTRILEGALVVRREVTR